MTQAEFEKLDLVTEERVKAGDKLVWYTEDGEDLYSLAARVVDGPIKILAVWWDKPVGGFSTYTFGLKRINHSLRMAPKLPERRTVWLNVYVASYYGLLGAHSTEDKADKSCDSNRDGSAVPVTLERGADGNWHVVLDGGK